MLLVNVIKHLWLAGGVSTEDEDSYDEDFVNAIDRMCTLNLFFTATTDKEAIDLSNIEALRNGDQEALLLGLLHPFLTGYALILKLIIVMTSEVPDHSEQELRFHLQKKLEDEISIGHFIPKYVLSMDLIINALTAYTMMGALQKWQKGESMMIRPIVSVCRSIQQDLGKRF
ncbi:Protein of unknown function [Gryllus bimaculatus]|nr:Protein of unknown function [Gryllus bimaculatus]